MLPKKVQRIDETKDVPEWFYENLNSVLTALGTVQTPLKIYITVDAMDESDEN